MKRFFALLLACLMLAVTLVACSNDPTTGTETTAEVTQGQTTPEKPTEKPTEASTQKPAEKPTEKPTEEPTQTPTEEPTTEAPIDPLKPNGEYGGFGENVTDAWDWNN